MAQELLPLLQSATEIETGGAVASTSRPTAVVCGGSAHTKHTSYTELLAATAFQAQGIIVQILRDAGAPVDGLIDLGIGAASSERALISNIGWFNISDFCFVYYYFPLKIAAGSRISGNAQSTAATQNPKVQVTLVGGGPFGQEGFTEVTTYGANTADSGGVSVDPGAAANTKGAWSEIVASTATPIRQLLIYLGNQVNTGRATASWHFDVGVGAAASERVVIPNLMTNNFLNFNEFRPNTYGPIPCYIPSGSRIAMRAQCDITDATDRTFDVILYGLS